MVNSVTLDKKECVGCTTCMKHCPTGAIRVRRGRAHILRQRCIDCGNCIRVCPHKAKKAVCDSFDAIYNYQYKIALPAPSLYGQFHNLDDINIVLTALLDIGFDDVFEVSRAAEIISELMRQKIAQSGDKLPVPYISSACPAAVRLVCMRFPELIPNISDAIAPAELAAILARKEAVKKTGLAADKIGVFFITPCPAKVTTAWHPLRLENRVIDGAISMADIYKRLLPAMRKITEPKKLSKSGIVGIGWARSGGEASGLLVGERYLAVDGIDNIIKILSDFEDGRLSEVSFLELNACTQGCVGGCLAVENPYVAKGRINRLMRNLPVSRNKASEFTYENIHADRELEYQPVGQLDENWEVALQKYARIEALKEELPGLDCGSCGAPSCRALAEDIVMGYASEEDCIFKMRERMLYITGGNEDDADAYLPPPFRKGNDDDD